MILKTLNFSMHERDGESSYLINKIDVEFEYDNRHQINMYVSRYFKTIILLPHTTRLNSRSHSIVSNFICFSLIIFSTQPLLLIKIVNFL